MSEESCKASSIETVVFKPTGTVQIANKFNLIERRLLNSLIWHAQRRRQRGTPIYFDAEHKISVKEVLRLIGLGKSHNTEVLRDALRTLTGTLIEWNIFGQDRTTEWGVCTFLSTGILKGGTLYYRLNPMISRQIYEPKLYAKIQLLIQARVRRRYALVLYEFFSDALSRSKVQTVHVQAPLLEIYGLLGIDGGMEFKFFNRDVLRPSLSEIKERTDLDISVETLRRGRRIVDLLFQVDLKPQFQFPLEFDDFPEDPIAEDSQDVLEPAGVTEAISLEGNPVLAILTQHGIKEAAAAELLQNYDEQQIKANVDYVLSKKQAGARMPNVAGYLIRAIEENYSSSGLGDPEETEEATCTSLPSRKAAGRDRENLEREWNRFRSDRIRAYFQEKPADWQDRERQQFIARIRNTDPTLFGMYERSGFRSRAVQALFYLGLQELLIKPEEIDFESYLNWRQGEGPAVQ